jgi:hypothetical protein
MMCRHLQSHTTSAQLNLTQHGLHHQVGHWRRIDRQMLCR